MNFKAIFSSLCLAACLFCMTPAYSADEPVPTDPAVDNFIFTGLTRGMTIEALVVQAIERSPSKTNAIVARSILSRPEKAGRIIALAIRKGAVAEEIVGIGIRVAPQHSGEIVGFAVRAAPSRAGFIAQAAVENGVQPQAIAPIFNAYLSQESTPPQQLASLNAGKAPTQVLDPTPPAATTAELAPPAISTPLLVIPPARGGSAPVASAN